MGLFLNLSGVIGASSEEVSKVLAAYAADNFGEFALVPGSPNNQDVAVIAQQGSNTSFVHPSSFDNGFELSQELSRRLGKTIFSFHIHDDDLWMYILYDKGAEVGHFNPVPEYWGTLSSEENKLWAGDARLVSKLVPGIQPSSIEKYLIEWDFSRDELEKAYPEDNYIIGDCWQMCDFMKKLGLSFPLGPDGNPLGTTYRLVIPQPSSNGSLQRKSESRTKRTWWKFW